MRAQIATILGVPVFVDFSLIFLILFFAGPELRSGQSELMLIGLAIAAALIGSIFIHEMAHAIAGRRFGVAASHIELNALGGYCAFERSLPGGVLPQLVVSAVGPLSNLLLWGLCQFLATLEPVSSSGTAYAIVAQVGEINLLLFLLNALPAYPLDGGKALEAILRADVSYPTAKSIVAAFSLLSLGYLAINYHYSPVWLLMICALILIATYREVVDTPLWRRLSGR